VYMIERTESAPVYDLAIAETHNFVANDFIVRTSSWSSRVAAGCIELGEQTTHANRVDRPTSESVWRPGDGGTDELDKSWG